jgi:uncharacterized protein YndB with AHSA1/START domain
MNSERIDTASRLVPAQPDAVYQALVDPNALMAWLPPTGMTGEVLEFDPRPGGRYRFELHYVDALPPSGEGKSSVDSDIVEGRFVALEPGRRMVQTGIFESEDPAFAGEMTIAWTLDPATDGTLVTVAATNVPAGISKADHDAGLRSSLDNLARFLSR